MAAFNGAATVVLVLLGVWEVQEARACRICACGRSVYVLEAPLARVHPYVACVKGTFHGRDPGNTDSALPSFTSDSTHLARYMAARS